MPFLTQSSPVELQLLAEDDVPEVMEDVGAVLNVDTPRKSPGTKEQAAQHCPETMNAAPTPTFSCLHYHGHRVLRWSVRWD